MLGCNKKEKPLKVEEIVLHRMDLILNVPTLAL